MNSFLKTRMAVLAGALGLVAPLLAGATTSMASAGTSPQCEYLRVGANKTITGKCKPADGQRAFDVGFSCVPDTPSARHYHRVSSSTGGYVVFGFGSGCWGWLEDSLAVYLV